MAAMPLHTGGLPQGELLGRYRSYEDAQKVVDHLAADQSFDVKALTIVGNELRSVEKVRGRLSYPRVAGTGALQGALFGTFMGLLLMLFSPQDPLVSLGMAVLMGMGIWMIIGVISFAARRGTRGFVSASQLVATTFDVVCDFQVAGKARKLVPGAGVTSLNAWNDPTGKSAALGGGSTPQSSQSTPVQPAGSPPQTTTPQPAAPGPGPNGPDTQDAAAGSSAQSAGAQSSHAPGTDPKEAGAEAPDQQEPASAPLVNRFEEDGRPRYGVRLADVQQQESAAEEAKTAAEESAEEPVEAEGQQRAEDAASPAEDPEAERPESSGAQDAEESRAPK